MARLMAIATHHKGGTVWLRRVIKALSRQIGVPWMGLWSDRQTRLIPQSDRAFLCNWHGWFPRALWDRDDVAFVHLIRDPRDILLSGCDYHQVAGRKGEGFLHKPRADLGGRTYQEHLNALSCYDDKLRFEMDNKHAETVAQMRRWPSDDQRCFELRYEALMQDRDMTLFGRALTHLGLRGGEHEAGLAAFWSNSLFGGLADGAARTGRLDQHIRSGGRLCRWKTELPRSIGRAYAARFGGDLRMLGYADDDTWADALPERVAA